MASERLDPALPEDRATAHESTDVLGLSHLVRPGVRPQENWEERVQPGAQTSPAPRETSSLPRNQGNTQPAGLFLVITPCGRARGRAGSLSLVEFVDLSGSRDRGWFPHLLPGEHMSVRVKA